MPRRLSRGASTGLKTGLAIVTNASRWALACLAFLLAAKANPAADISSQLIFFGTWPHQVVVFDSAQEKIVDNIDLKPAVARIEHLAPHKKKIFVSVKNGN